MGSRELTMTEPQVSPLFRRIFFLLGKLGLLVLLTMAAGWGYGYALLGSNLLPETANRLVVVCMSAAVGGLLARFIFRNEGLLPSALGAFLSVIVSLLDLGNLSGGHIGLPIPDQWINLWDTPALWQLIPIPFVLFLALTAWRQPGFKPPPTSSNARVIPLPARKSGEANRKPARKNTRRKSFPFQKRLIKPLRAFYSKTRKRLTKLFAKTKAGTRRAIRRMAAALPDRRSSAPAPLPVVKFHRAVREPAASAVAVPSIRRQPKAVHSPIRLVGREEHRCPYCLCIVSPRDPDGVVLCPVCHTYHHKSCWDVTGSCQVPHIHP